MWFDVEWSCIERNLHGPRIAVERKFCRVWTRVVRFGSEHARAAKLWPGLRLYLSRYLFIACSFLTRMEIIGDCDVSLFIY